MSLRRFAVENYRCFRDRQELEIFPVTVVLGKNNSGKSALVRAPLIFATGFGADTTAPLDLELGPDSVDAFTDLIFGQNAHGRIGVELETDGDQPFALMADIQHIDETGEALINEFSLRLGDEQVRLSWERSLFPAEGPHTYSIRTSTTSRQAPVGFQGLLPRPQSAPELRMLRGIELSLGPIRYLGPYRARPSRYHPLPLGVPRGLGWQAEGLAAILAHDQARDGSKLIRMVDPLLRAIAPDWRLGEVPMGPLWATVLTRGPNDEIKVNLADAGAGVAQVLPILVQCAMDQLSGRDSAGTLQIIEEPETHLHPGAHAELAELYLATAHLTGTRFLIETHSETLLLRLRRRIAQGDFGPDMVGVFVVEQTDGVSTVRRVDIDELGNLGAGWPDGYFSQDYHEVRALAAAQMKRSERAS